MPNMFMVEDPVRVTFKDATSFSGTIRFAEGRVLHIEENSNDLTTISAFYCLKDGVSYMRHCGKLAEICICHKEHDSE